MIAYISLRSIGIGLFIFNVILPIHVTLLNLFFCSNRQCRLLKELIDILFFILFKNSTLWFHCHFHHLIFNFLSIFSILLWFFNVVVIEVVRGRRFLLQYLLLFLISIVTWSAHLLYLIIWKYHRLWLIVKGWLIVRSILDLNEFYTINLIALLLRYLDHILSHANKLNIERVMLLCPTFPLNFFL